MVKSDGANQQICQRIKDVRKTLGYSQEQFGQSIGMSQTHVGAVETCARPVHERTIKMVSMVYGVSENWLRTGGGRMWETEKDPRFERVWQVFRKLDPMLQDCVIQQMDALAAYQEKKAEGGGA